MIILYKYLTPERVDILEDLKIRFTQPKYFNDPFDSVYNIKTLVPQEIIQKDFDVERVCDEFIIKWEREVTRLLSLKKINLTFEDILKHDGTNRKEFRKNILQSMKGFYSLLILNDKELKDLFVNQLGNYVGILSLTESPDNIPMWAHYAQIHTGFVLIFRTSSSFFKGDNKIKFQGLLNKVKYSYNHMIFDSLIDLSMGSFYYKSRSWEYEQEWRMILPLQFASTKKDPDIYLYDISPSTISGVILGYRSDPELYERLLTLKEKNQHFSSLKIYKAIPDYNEYKMRIERIYEKRFF